MIRFEDYQMDSASMGEENPIADIFNIEYIHAGYEVTDRVPEGWNGVIAPDPDGAHYLLLSNFVSDRKCTLAEVTCPP